MKQKRSGAVHILTAFILGDRKFYVTVVGSF
jgi:hypothetical protein